jgi:hypothetical protein
MRFKLLLRILRSWVRKNKVRRIQLYRSRVGDYYVNDFLGLRRCRLVFSHFICLVLGSADQRGLNLSIRRLRCYCKEKSYDFFLNHFYFIKTSLRASLDVRSTCTRWRLASQFQERKNGHIAIQYLRISTKFQNQLAFE